MNFSDFTRKKPSLAFFRFVDRSQRQGLAGATPAASCGSCTRKKPSLAFFRSGSRRTPRVRPLAPAASGGGGG